MNKQIELLDEGFDGLDFYTATERKPRPQLVAHCDCQHANEAFFGEPLASVKEGDWSYTMVPTEAEGDACIHCGYHVFMQPAGNLKRAISNRKLAKKAATRHAPVVGTNTLTGEQVTYPTAKAAYEAGFGSIAWAIRNGRELKGYTWRRA